MTISSRRTPRSIPATAAVLSAIWPERSWASTRPSSPRRRASALPFPSIWPRKSSSDLKTSGKITRGWLGLTSQDITDDMRQSLKLKDRQGALVGNVFAGDAADKAGIKIGDVILEIDGKTVKDDRELGQIVAKLHVGSKVNIKIFRNGKEITLPIVIAERKDPQEQASAATLQNSSA